MYDPEMYEQVVALDAHEVDLKKSISIDKWRLNKISK